MKNFARIIELPEYDVLIMKTNDTYNDDAPQLKLTFCLESGVTIEITGGFPEERRQHRDERYESITAEEAQVLVDKHRSVLEGDEPRVDVLFDSTDDVLLYRAHKPLDDENHN